MCGNNVQSEEHMKTAAENTDMCEKTWGVG
jgi:hypothetical protein